MPRNRLTEEFCRGIFIPFVSPAREVSRVTAARDFRDKAGNIDHGCRSATTPVAIMGCLLSPGLKSLNIGKSMDGRQQSFRACSKSGFTANAQAHLRVSTMFGSFTVCGQRWCGKHSDRDHATPLAQLRASMLVNSRCRFTS
jgi:hypothetical protein